MNPVAQKYGAAPLAGVNLIPVEIAERKKMRAVTSMALLVVAAALVVVVLGFLGALALKAAAQGEYDEASSAEAAAVAERDGKASVYDAVAQREMEEYALAQIGSGEIDYAEFTASIQQVFEDAVLDTLTISGPTATGAGDGEGDSQLYGQGVGRVNFSARTASLETATALVDALEAVPGIANVRSQTDAFAGGDGELYWAISGVGTITPSVLTGRLVPEESVSGVGQLLAPAPSVSASPTPEPSPATTEES